MIKELVENKNKYFWSTSSKGSIIIGGYNHGRFYGQIEFSIDENTATIKMDVSNGVSSAMGLAERLYSNLTQEYQLIEEMFNHIDEYLTDPNTKLHQELNRTELIQNVMNLLPKYSNI